jgi:undecaprenyl-phosphate 4-deoxy-4-formamido-L-arabinose transferase
VSVVVPVYNSADTVPALLQRLRSALSEVDGGFEIILVDDGSADGSWEALCEQQRAAPDEVVAIQLMRNYGQHNALMCGLNACSRDLIVTIDDDLQNPPEEIPRMIETLESRRLDVLYGVPPERKHARWRNAGALVVQAFYRLVFRTSITPTSFRVLRRQVAGAICKYDLNYTYIDGLLAWCTDRIGSLEVAHAAREVGRSGYSMRKLLLLAFNLFANFSLLPLQLVSFMGLIAALAGFTVGGYYLFQYFHSSITVPGFASTIMAVLVLGGAQMLALGIIGEYLGRLHLNVNKKPQYVVRRMLVSDTREIDKGGNVDPRI